jgi:hypothetical protein
MLTERRLLLRVLEGLLILTRSGISHDRDRSEVARMLSSQGRNSASQARDRLTATQHDVHISNEDREENTNNGVMFKVYCVVSP